MKYFYDTEFNENGKTIELISIGVVSEDGREFYAINSNFDANACNDWVKSNVLPWLVKKDMSTIDADGIPKPMPPWYEYRHIKYALIDFIGEDKPEWWGYYSAYDHVALCQLFGAMVDLPNNWPFYTNDIKQLCVSLGNPELPKQESTEHHALADARWNKQAYDFLAQINASHVEGALSHEKN